MSRNKDDVKKLAGSKPGQDGDDAVADKEDAAENADDAASDWEEEDWEEEDAEEEDPDDEAVRRAWGM